MLAGEKLLGSEKAPAQIELAPPSASSAPAKKEQPPQQANLSPVDDAPRPASNPRSPVNAIAIVAPGTRVFPELMRTLVSISQSAPSAVVLLLVTKTEADALQPFIALPGEPRSAAKLSLTLRIYNWDYFNDRLPDAVKPRFPSIKRYSVYPAVLEDMANGGALGTAHPEAVFFTNVPPESLRRPDAVMLSDGRDVIFQRDPFAEMWARVSARVASAAQAQGQPKTSVPGGGAGWGDGLQDVKYILAAQEAEVMKLKDEDWNRSWVHYW